MAAPRNSTSRRALGLWLGCGGALLLSLGPSAGASTAGRTLWVARYEGPQKNNDVANAIAVSPDGSKVFVTGESVGNFDDFATIAYDASTGMKLWLKRFDNGEDSATSVAVSPDGSKVFVTGWSATSNFDYTTLAYDSSTGHTLWATRYDSGSSQDRAYSIATSPDGSMVFITGSTGSDYATVAYDTSTGAQLWASLYRKGRGGASSLAVSPDGSRVFVTGGSKVAGTDVDYATVAYAASTGVQLWVKRFNGADHQDFASAVAISPDGTTVFVTGASDVIVNKSVYATIAYEASTGTTRWISRQGPAYFNNRAYSLAVSPDGSRVFVTGERVDDYCTVAYDAVSGAKLWLKRNYGLGEDTARAVRVSPDGSRVFVTGTVFRSGSVSDYGTFAYDAATGRTEWRHFHDGPAHNFDDATSLAVSPDGSRVFVTGDDVTNSADYATIAYAA